MVVDWEDGVWSLDASSMLFLLLFVFFSFWDYFLLEDSVQEGWSLLIRVV